MEQNRLTDLKRNIAGRGYELAQTLIGLMPNDGRDREKHQRCPIPSCSSLHDGFRYNADTDKFHCRKCEFGGDIFDLLMAVRGIDFNEAARLVAQEAGVRWEDNPQPRGTGAPLKLFTSSPRTISKPTQTTYCTDATVVTADSDFFRFDHTPIRFKDGQRAGKNFEYATAVVFDIDNADSDNPDDWITADSISQKLQAMKITHWLVASRNHMRDKKDKKGCLHAARPRFHCYLPLATPCAKERYLAFCEWCIAEFKSDPEVKSPSQTIFGYGHNDRRFVQHWAGSRCFDEFFDSAQPVASKTKSTESPPLLQGQQRVDVVRWSDIEDGEQTWLWENKLAIGDLTLVSGAGSVGKSFFTCYLASHVTNGYDWLDGTPCEKGTVIFFPIEGKQKIFKKRLFANGVNLKNCFLWRGASYFDQGTKQWIQNPVCLDQRLSIEQALDEVEVMSGLPVKLLIADPVGNFLGDINTYKDSEVRRVLMPLQEIAERRGIAIILIAHHGKAEQSSSQHKTLGSVALVNTPRAVWQIYRDKTDKNLRYFTPSKTNDCVDPTTVAFRIVQPGQVQIENTSVNKTADDFMMAERQQFPPGPPPEERRKCENRLAEILAEGEKPQLEIMEVLLEEGFSDATIHRAKKTLGVKNRKNGFQGASYWHLPLISTPPQTFQVQPDMFDSSQTLQDTVFTQNTEKTGT